MIEKAIPIRPDWLGIAKATARMEKIQKIGPFNLVLYGKGGGIIGKVVLLRRRCLIGDAVGPTLRSVSIGRYQFHPRLSRRQCRNGTTFFRNDCRTPHPDRIQYTRHVLRRLGNGFRHRIMGHRKSSKTVLFRVLGRIVSSRDIIDTSQDTEQAMGSEFV